MDEKFRQEALKKALGKRFKGHKTIKAKIAPIYPSAMESQFRGITDAYMRLVNQVVSKHLPEIRDAATAEREAGRRADDMNSLMSAIQAAFAAMSKDLEIETDRFDLYGKLQSLSELTTKLSIRQWKRVIKNTLGLDLMDDYYSGEFFRQILDQWVSQNVALIKTLPQSTLGEMRELVYEGFRTGETITTIVKEIQQTYSMNKRHARLIARDQMAKLNSEITQRQQTDAGVEEYIWSDSHDEQVRESHHALNGKVFRWDDPPVVDVKTGRRCHPGQDYQCRCVAIPRFNIESIDVPAMTMKGGG